MASVRKAFKGCCSCASDDAVSSPAPPITGPTDLKPGDSNMGEVYEEIRQRCLRTGTLFEDPSFPPSTRILFKSPSTPLYGIKWKRPKELSRYPIFIQEGPVYYDMHQGTVGDCWFVASVCCVAASPQRGILSRVVPKDQGFGRDYCGAFHFRFWQYGRWVEVVIDDRLPTLNNQLIYGWNRRYPDEYWCPLLEKAFAKLHGNYDILDGGRIHSSLVDLTGGIGEMLPLRNKITDEELSEILLNCQKMNSIMGAAIFVKNPVPGEREIRQDTGLFEGHAYTIVEVKVASTRYGSTTLLHMRNPWGWGEWNGAWSDGSREWSTLSTADRYATYKTEDDGEFWISVSDFRTHFDELELCHLTPDGLTQEIANNMRRSNWQTTEHYGSWVRGLSAGGPPISFTSEKFWSNPQLELRIPDAKGPTTVVISLFEVDRLLQRETGDISIGFVIFKFQDGRKPDRITARNFYDYNPKMVKTSGIYWPYREKTIRYRMDPGDHIIVPCTYKPDQEAEFYVRVFSELHVESRPVKPAPDKETIPLSFKDKTETVIEEKFDEFAKGAGLIDAAELVEVFKAGLKAGEGQEKGFNLETCRCLIGLTNVQTSTGMLTKDGVLKIWIDMANWRKAFRLVDKNENNFIDSTELKSVFDAIDFHASKETLDAIIKRYGNKQRRISEEDFLQSFCKAMMQYRLFRDLESNRKVRLSLDEWMSITMAV